MRRRRSVIAVITALLLVSDLRADAGSGPASGPTSGPASDTPASPTAAEVADAPRPDRSDGVARPQDASASLPSLPRAVLFVPRMAFRAALEPLRWAGYAWDRLQIPQRFKDIFFNEAGTFGIFPVAFVDTGFGLNAGVRLIHRDLFGAGESLTLRASFGGRYDSFFAGSIGTGDRLGPVSLGLAGGYERGPEDRFYGIGNGDEQSLESIGEPIDALRDQTAVNTKYRRDLVFAKLSLGVQLMRFVAAKLSTELRFQSFEEREGVADDTFVVYRPESLVGLQRGTSDVYTQLHLSFDNRETLGRFVPATITSRGIYLGAWLGYARGFDQDPSNHLRYAVDLQWFINLFRGDRVLILRLLLDGVTADLDKIPFTDLPDLGGDRLLRGYDFRRFVDRVVTLGSAEYQYTLSNKATAYLFVDSGRVWRSLDQFGFDDYRLGFGGGLLLHSLDAFMARLQFASSKDGGFFFNFSLDPVYAPRARQEPRI